MRAGRLDRLITIQRSSQTQEDDGHPVKSWATIGETRRPASIDPLRGEERFVADQFVASEQVEIRIHYSSAVADLSPLDRVIYPALTGNSPEEEIGTRRVYDIMAAHEIGRREGIRILAVRRTDITT